MSLIILGMSIVLLLLLIAKLKTNAFLALLLASLFVGLSNGLLPDVTLSAMLKGVGDTMGNLALILAFGAMLGKIIEESGAAHTITYRLTALFGISRIQLSVVITGFLVGLPMIYNASFLTLIPLIYTFSSVTGTPLMQLGIPLSSALSVTHGYLPPHPAPTAIAQLYGADPNLTLLLGLVLAVPATYLAGPWLSRFFRQLRNSPPGEFHAERRFAREALPGISRSLAVMLIPVFLMMTGAAVTLAWGKAGTFARGVLFLSDPNVALGLAVLAGILLLARRNGRGMEDIMKSLGGAVASVAMVLFIIAGGGAFKQVLIESGTGKSIELLARGLQWSPLVLAWSTSALLRLALGSATVAAITASGVVLPLLANSGIRPELMVLATASGSLMFSHFNDIGFWMFKEYYNVSIKQTFQIWTVMESIVAIVGLAGVLLFNIILPGSKSITSAKAQPRVFYVNSYHAGYGSSDAVMSGIRDTLGPRVELQSFFLDAKQHPQPEEIKRKTEEALAAIRAFRPDLLIASDDDAVKHLVVPHFKDGPLPVVFCGVNWSCEPYGLPTPYVTGMLEVVPIEEAIRTMQRHYSGLRRLTILSEDTTSERRNSEILDSLYRRLGLQPHYALVQDFESWKDEFVKANNQSDLIYLPTNGAVRGWDNALAARWVLQHIRKPVITCDDFMMPYAVLGLTKVAREQGEWTAQRALEILSGKAPGSIPVASNRQSQVYLNTALASKIGFVPNPDLRSRCRRYP